MSSIPTANQKPPPVERLLKIVQQIASELHPQLARSARIDLDTPLEATLGFDSLGRLELVAQVERAFEVRLADHVFGTAETPRDLLEAIANAGGRGIDMQPVPAAPTTSETVGIPENAATLTEVLDWHATHHGERVHLQLIEQEGENDAPMSYAELRKAAHAIAAGLQHRGLQTGDTVALMLPTGRDYFMAFFGILYAGGVPVPLYPPARPTQLEDHMLRQADILGNAACTLLITVPQAKPLAQLLRLRASTLKAVYTVSDLTTGVSVGFPILSGNRIAFLQYTSGSTGNPKGVILTHDNLLANIRADGAVIEAQSSDVFVSWLPLYHDMGLIGAWLGSLYFGARLVIMSPLAFLARPERWLWALHRHGGTLSAAPNFAYGLCVSRIDDRDIEGLDLSRWRLTLNGAEAISPDTLRAFERRFTPYGFRPEAMYPVYGLAECSVGLTFPPLHRRPIVDHIDRRLFAQKGRAVAVPADEKALSFVACGRPLPGHEIRIVDNNSHELPERHEGRLQFRGPSATRGYYRNDEATRGLFDGDWLETGDRAYMAAGDLYITGRSKDMIIRAGRNIHPQELEEAIGSLPGVRTGRVAVFSDRQPNAATDRLIVLAETHLADDAQARVREQINRLTTDLTWSAADEIVLAPPGTVLKTSSGKLRRAASREVWRRGLVGRSHAPVWWQGARLALSALPGLLPRTWYGLMGRLWGIYARSLFYLFAALSYLLVLVVPRRWRWGAMRTLGRLLAATTGVRLIVRGVEHLPGPETQCIFVANHASYIDSYVVATVLPRDLSFVAKSELRDAAFSRIYLDRLSTIYVKRGETRQSAADAAATTHAASAGHSLVFFPEGTFARQPGLLPFHLGAFVTAAKTRLPLIPIAIQGTRNILRAGSWLPHRGEITVTIGAPLRTQAMTGESEDTWRLALRLRDQARDHIRSCSGEPDIG